jgi:hypothetical protein
MLGGYMKTHRFELVYIHEHILHNQQSRAHLAVQ